nr:hypothetical protein [Tanacetum cinerariifolium]
MLILFLMVKSWLFIVLEVPSTLILDHFERTLISELRKVSLRCSGNTTRIMHRTLMVTIVFTLCEEQVIWNSVLMRLIDDLLALDSIVRFGFSDQRLERTATFSILTNSK